MAMLFLRTSLLVAVFLAGHFGIVSSAVKIDVTTQYHDKAIPNAFNIRCTPNPLGSCAMTIISIQVDKDNNKNIANLRGQDSITYNPILKSSVSAEGLIHTDLTKTFLSVTVNEAVIADSGLYTCKLLYIDERLQFKFVTASQNVTVTEQDTQDIIKHLMSKISFLENLVQYELSTLKTAMVDQGTQLQTQALRINQTNSKILGDASNLQDIIRIQNQRIDDIIARDNTTVSFIATHTRTGDFGSGKDFVYSHVIENIGGGYNANTGVFTAPVAGYYLLSVSASANSGKAVELDLMSSQERTLARLRSYDNSQVDTEDTSCVARLLAGERVWPHGRSVSGGSPLWGRDTPDSLNKFYGYLLKML